MPYYPLYFQKPPIFGKWVFFGKHPFSKNKWVMTSSFQKRTHVHIYVYICIYIYRYRHIHTGYRYRWLTGLCVIQATDPIHTQTHTPINTNPFSLSPFRSLTCYRYRAARRLVCGRSDWGHRTYWARRRSRLSMCDMDYSDVWHDSFRCVTWLIRMCDVTYLVVAHDSFRCVRYDLIRCVTWPIQWSDRTYLDVWQDSFILLTSASLRCVTWPILMCEVS